MKISSNKNNNNISHKEMSPLESLKDSEKKSCPENQLLYSLSIPSWPCPNTHLNCQFSEPGHNLVVKGSVKIPRGSEKARKGSKYG